MAPWWGSHLESPHKEKMRAPAGGQDKGKKTWEGLDAEKNNIREPLLSKET